MRGKIRIEEDEMVVLYLQGAGTQGEQAAEGMEETEESAGRSAEKPSETVLSPVRAGRIEFQRFSFYEFGPDAPGETSFLRSSFSAEPTLTRELCGKEDLIPWHEMDPSLEYAAGAGVYEGTLTVERMPGKGERLILDLGDVYDTFTVKVNGKETPFPDQVMKRVDVTGMVKMGENRIEVRVVSELHNRLIGGNAGKPLADGMPRPVYVPRRYGICPSEEKPAGVYLL